MSDRQWFSIFVPDEYDFFFKSSFLFGARSDAVVKWVLLLSLRSTLAPLSPCVLNFFYCGAFYPLVSPVWPQSAQLRS